MLRDFKAFLLRATSSTWPWASSSAFAFGALVKALIDDLIMPIIAAIIGKPDFSQLHFVIHNSVFMYGSFINAVINFLSVATAVFFFVVQPVNKIMARYRTEPAPDPTIKKCQECLSDIPVDARKCAFCASLQA